MHQKLHHIEWFVTLDKFDDTLEKLTRWYGFTQTAQRRHVVPHREIPPVPDQLYRQHVVNNGEICFVITSPDEGDAKCSEMMYESSTAYPLILPDNTSRSTVFNVCYEVNNDRDVDRIVENVMRYERSLSSKHNETVQNKEMVIVQPQKLNWSNNNKIHCDENCFKLRKAADNTNIYLAVVRSWCSNVIHTLISSNNSDFLPGFGLIPTICNVDSNLSSRDSKFEISDNDDAIESLLKKCDDSGVMKANLVSHIDHITYVCEHGQSDEVLKWYKDCFGMERFVTNSAENLATGVTIDDVDINMRLKVGEWMTDWLCSETHIGSINPDNDKLLQNFKLVVVEPLANINARRENSSRLTHIEVFLKEHQGPGVQHIGLHATEDVTKTITSMRRCGAKFRHPPPTYYQLPCKLKEIEDAGLDVEVMSRLGLLVDCETFDVNDYEENNSVSEKSALVQIFTYPLFGPHENTFFLEVLQRCGENATGFGSSNIIALAKSIELMKTLG